MQTDLKMYQVLIVDDEPVICEGLHRMLDWNSWQFEVAGTAGNGRDAMEKIKELNIDLVLTDIRMPVIDGIELCRRIHEHNPHVKVIIISGYGEFDYARKAIEYGVTAYLLKPVIPEELSEKLISIRKQLEEQSGRNPRIEKSGKPKRLIDEIIGYINENYPEDLTLISIAEKFFLNSAYLGQLFKETTGMPFNQYINEKRIQEAKRLCQSGEWKIYEIIERVGYKHTEHFYKQFKKLEGISFAEFRSKIDISHL